MKILLYKCDFGTEFYLASGNDHIQPDGPIIEECKNGRRIGWIPAQAEYIKHWGSITYLNEKSLYNKYLKAYNIAQKYLNLK